MTEDSGKNGYRPLSEFVMMKWEQDSGITFLYRFAPKKPGFRGELFLSEKEVTALRKELAK